MKIVTMLLTLLAISAVMCGTCAAEETRVFVDDVGRKITLPTEIDAVSPSGPLAQLVLYSIDPDLFVSISSKFTEMQVKYIDPKVVNLPLTGQFYGSSASTMSPEEIMELNKKLHIDVIIDAGDNKPTMQKDLDEIQAKTGVSFAFITQYKLSSIPDSYRKLGELLSRKEQGEALATYVEDVLTEFNEGMKEVGDNKKSLIWVTSVSGNSVYMVGKESYHGEVIDMISENLVPKAVSSGGGGDQYTLEDVLSMNPDVIIVSYTADHESYLHIMNDPMWQNLPAVKNGEVYESPYGPYNWMGGPPSVQRLLSMIWIGNILYPEVFEYNIDERVKEFYRLFFHYELSDEDLSELMMYAKKNSLAVPTSTSASVPIFGVLAGIAAAVFIRPRV